MALRIEFDKIVHGVLARAAANAFKALALIAAVTALPLSCSSREGWALVLWPPEGSALACGAVAPIHFLSNITKTYAVGVPGSKANEELALWRVEPYKTKSKAKAAAAAYGGLLPMFGVATRDGLLFREKPDNTSTQVYRLKLGQAVKLLEKTKGIAVQTAGTALEGDWYRALAEDGTSGFIFSNQLRLWNASTEARPDMSLDTPSADIAISSLFDTIWRPDYFETMIASGLIDLGSYLPRFGLFADPQRKQIRVERPDFSRVYNYESFNRRDDGSYEIVPGGASFYFTKTGNLVFVPALSELPADLKTAVTDSAAEAPVVSFAFGAQRENVQDVVAAEERRRLSQLAQFVSGGERFESGQYGVFLATKSARFTWVAHGAMTPAVIPEDAGETGSIAMDLYLSPELSADWNGAFTLRFDGGKRPAVSFAYRLDGDILSLAFVPPDSVKSAIVSAPAGLETVATMNRYR